MMINSLSISWTYAKSSAMTQQVWPVA